MGKISFVCALLLVLYNQAAVINDFFSIMFSTYSSLEICWMFTIALEWQRLLSLSATPARLIFQKLKGKLQVQKVLCLF